MVKYAVKKSLIETQANLHIEWDRNHMHLIGHFINVKRTNRNKADSILKPQGPHIKEVSKQHSDGNGIEWTSLPFPQIICNTCFKQQLKRLAKSWNRRYCCSPQKLLQHVSPWLLNGAISWTKFWWKRWNRHLATKNARAPSRYRERPDEWPSAAWSRHAKRKYGYGEQSSTITDTPFRSKI